MLEYEAVFEDERVEDSVDDRPIFELSNRDKHKHRFVANGLRFDDSVPFIIHDNVIIW
jgi:hypothetical protein